MIGLVTDSNAMLPDWLRDRFGIRVVPLGLTLDGRPLLEDEDLDRAAVLDSMRRGASLTTSAPSPGSMADEFDRAKAAGATRIVAIHLGGDYSSTVESARLAARSVDIPIEVVDSGQASFSLGCCVWAAGEALASGGTATAAVSAALQTSARMASVFTITELPRAEAGGRFAGTLDLEQRGSPLMAIDGDGLHTLFSVGHREEALEGMLAFIAAQSSSHLRVGVGDAGDDDAGARLAGMLGLAPNVAEVVRYRCGPSVAAHVGVGTFGAVFHPIGG